MSYNQTSWQNSPSTASPIDAANLDNLETQYTEASNSIITDLYKGFVIGLVPTKASTPANQLNVSAGTIYLQSTQDSTLRRFPISAFSKTTATASTTYYLAFNYIAGSIGVAPSVNTHWSTTAPTETNHYTVAQVTTDSSGNISGVTDMTLNRGVAAHSMPFTASFTVGGLLAHYYTLPSNSVDDIPGQYLGSQIVGPIDWTNHTFAGVSSNYVMRIVGAIKPAFSETYTFYVTVDDAARLYIGDQEIIGNVAWKSQSSTTYSGTISLTANQWYPIILEHAQATATEVLKLEWQSTSQTRGDVPATNMAWQHDGGQNAVVARYVYAHYGMKIAGNTVWHAGNDGAGSGLDADVLDGHRYTPSTTQPSSPADGDVWIDAIHVNPFASISSLSLLRERSAYLPRTLSRFARATSALDYFEALL